MYIFYIILLFLHGLVHLLYLGHSRGWFELANNMEWPSNSVFLRNSFSHAAIKIAACSLLLLASLAFVLSAMLLLFPYSYWRICLFVAFGLSTFTYLLFWDGSLNKIHDQGAIGIVINILLLIYPFVFNVN